MPRKPYEFTGYGLELGRCVHKIDIRYSSQIPHCHENFEVLFITDGRGCFENPPISLEIEAPCIILHRPYAFHSCEIYGECLGHYERYNFYLSPEWMSEHSELPSMDSLSPENMTVYPIPEAARKSFITLFELLCEEEDRISRGLLIGCILRRIATFTPIPTGHVSSDAQTYISRVMAYISEHHTETLTIDSIAERFFVSRTKLTSDFRRVSAYSIHEFILSLRLEHACELLKSGFNVTRCAMECGFTSYSSFIRAFTRRYGESPLRYARQLRG